MIMKKTKNIIFSNTGFTLIETMFAVAILTFLLGGAYALLATGQTSWANTETSIQLNESLRQVVNRVAMELRQTKQSEYQIFNDTGSGGTDIIRFSIPVVCEANTSVINSSGDVAYWRAPLTWGCTASTCMDVDNECDTVDYKYIEYQIDASKQLLRRVLDGNSAQVRQDIMAKNILDFQLGALTDGVSMQITAQKKSVQGRLMTDQTTVDIGFRN